MSVVRQLYQLQELDLEIDSSERALAQTLQQMGESEALLKAENQLKREEERLGELRHKQRSAEWELEDISTKLGAAEETLFSGRIKNPKELANLQHEVEILKANKARVEERVLEVMEQVEQCEGVISKLADELKTIKAQWQRQQQELAENAERLRTALSELRQRRQLLLEGIPPQALELYQGLRRERGTAVARVEQGVCRGCRISLPVSELQQVKSGSLVKCSSCGRILFLA